MSAVKAFLMAAREGVVAEVRKFLPRATNEQRDRALASAVRKGQYYVTKLLVEEEYALPKGEYLMDAVRSRHRNIVDVLLRAGVDVNYAASAGGKTVLMQAVSQCDERIVAMLLETNVNVDAEDSKSRTALSIALGKRYGEIAKLLLDRGASAQSQAHFFPWVIQNGNVELLNLLLAGGANPNVAHQNSYPLIIATNIGCEKMVTSLLEYGADVDVFDKKDRTALYHAVQTKNVKMVEALVKYSASAVSCGKLLLDMVKEKRTEMVLTLIKSMVGANSEDTSELLENALLTATMYGAEEVVKGLLDAGANVNCLSPKGVTPLHHALSGNFTSIAHMLKEKGAKSDTCESFMRHAITMGDYEQVKLLLSCGADPNVVDSTKEQIALIIAVQHEKVKIVCQLIEAGANVNYLPSTGRTALMCAAASGNREIVQILLDAKAQVNAQLKDGWTAVMYAAYFGHEHVVQLLIDAKSNLELRNSNNLMAIECISRRHENAYSIYRRLEFASANFNYYEADSSYFPIANKFHSKENILKLKQLDKKLIDNEIEREEGMNMLLEISNFGINSSDEFGRTILMFMAFKGYAGIVQLLLTNGALISSHDFRGTTALAFATCASKFQVVKLLIEKNCDVNFADYLDRTPLALAIRSRNKSIIRILSEAGGKLRTNFQMEGAIIWASINDYHNLISQLCNVRVNINEADDFNATALIWASYHGHISCMLQLLKFAPDINVVDSHGRTALWYALDQGHNDAVQILLPGAGLKDIDRGNPALCVAIRRSNVNSVDAILKRGARQEWTEPDGTTALMCAVLVDNLHLVDMMLKKGADVCSINQAGDTALHCAAAVTEAKIIDLLKEYGADIECKNKDGLTPLLLASRVANLVAVEALLKCGANVSATDNNGKSALDLAIRENEEINDSAAAVGEALIAWGVEAKELEKIALLILAHMEKKRNSEKKRTNDANPDADTTDGADGGNAEPNHKQEKLDDKVRNENENEIQENFKTEPLVEVKKEEQEVPPEKRWPVGILLDNKDPKKARYG